jgi:hypothetical protein
MATKEKQNRKRKEVKAKAKAKGKTKESEKPATVYYSTTFKVDVWNVKTDLFNYQFDWKIARGNKVKEGRYESDHAWHSEHLKLRKLLRSYLAANIALEQII